MMLKVTQKMLRKAFLLVLAAAIILSAGAASAQLTNAELQMRGGLVAVNGSDTFFFTPLESGGWGLYSVNKYSSGPISTIKDVKPSRLFYADSSAVYFLGIRPDEGYIFASIDLQTGYATPIIDKVKETYAETETTFFYVLPEDPYTLYRYSITDKKSTKIKNLASKKMYDAVVANKTIYLLTLDNAGAVAGYEMNANSGKASNLSNPNPKIGDGFLYNGYIIYSQKGDTTKVFSVPLKKTKAVRLGESITGISLYTPRFADALYPFDTSTNSIVRVPIDGSAASSLPLVSQGLKSAMIGGTADAIYYWDDGRVYSVSMLLQNKTELFEFDNQTDGMLWTTFAPTNNNHLLVMGYIPLTQADIDVSLPTAVRLVDLASRETVFVYPVPQDAAIEDPNDPNYVAPPEYIEDPAVDPEPVQYFDLLVGENEDVSFMDVFGN